MKIWIALHEESRLAVCFARVQLKIQKVLTCAADKPQWKTSNGVVLYVKLQDSPAHWSSLLLIVHYINRRMQHFFLFVQLLRSAGVCALFTIHFHTCSLVMLFWSIWPFAAQYVVMFCCLPLYKASCQPSSQNNREGNFSFFTNPGHDFQTQTVCSLHLFTYVSFL